ncbi:UDP-glycosyltransferase 73B4 [Abeliophyllum distichum]|uniref:Glycosyltransferase n=1 Tax=Abeliophyllum distichum TaxID=126358 RepID=A0ABD1QWT6_9LAMI
MACQNSSYLHQNCRAQPQVVVVMVPLPAQGHLNQLLHLSRLISVYNIPVHYVGATAHSRQAKLRVHGWDPLSVENFHFHEFQIPDFQSLPANSNASNKFPSHLQPAFDAMSHLRRPVASLLNSLSPTARRVIVIHDSLMSSVVQDIASIPNGESYVFHSVSAFSMFWYFWEVTGKPFLVDEEELEYLPSLEDCFTPEFTEFIEAEQKYLGFSCGSLYNSSKVIEGKYINLIKKISEEGNKKHWSIGPFNPVELTCLNQRHKCLEWLDKQEPKSVIFVSFGTTTSLTDDQISELAIGLEESGVRFIWVLRDADKGNIFTGENRKAELPQGFEERNRERGIVEREWAPQLEILAHSATGGFMSHCGWNSCMESISMGVPIAAWPMHSDQPRNTVLITNVLRIGLVVKDWRRRNEIVKSLTISTALTRLMASEEGEEMRQRAADLGIAVQKSVAKGGLTRMEMDSFIAHISRS